MAKLPVAFICLLLSAPAPILALKHCESRTGSPNINMQCQKYCARGQCPSFCLCNSSNSTDTCDKLDFAPDDKLVLNETVRPGTPIFTIQVLGQERWSYTLGRGGPVDGSVWNSLSKYLKLTKLGNQYEMIVDITPDLEDIFQRYGIKLTSLTLILTCERNGFPNKSTTKASLWKTLCGTGAHHGQLLRLLNQKDCSLMDNEIVLQILPVNEHAPEFFVTPLQTSVLENTKVGAEIFSLSDHTIDVDVNPTVNYLIAFGLWEYLPDSSRDGRTHFQMTDRLTGSIKVKTELDFEMLQPLDAARSFLNVSASDEYHVIYTTLTIDVTDVDDLPPEFYHSSCAEIKPCSIFYEATLPLHYRGQVTNIVPGQIEAQDMDSLNFPVKFLLKSGPGQESGIINKFSINETTGSLFVLSPFVEGSEVQLIVVAREISKNARFAQTTLLVRVNSTIPMEFVKLVSSSESSSSSTSNVSKQLRVNVYKIITLFLSICVLLLMLTSLILLAKLNTRRRRTSKVQPANVPYIPSKIISYSRDTDVEQKPATTFDSPSFSISHDDVNQEENLNPADTNMGLSIDRNQQNTACDPYMNLGLSFKRNHQSAASDLYTNMGLSNHRNQQNVACDPSSVIYLAPPLNYWRTNNFQQNKNVQVSKSALSSFQAERRISLTVSNGSDNDSGHYERLGPSNYIHAGRGRIRRQNVIADSNIPWLGKDSELDSNLLILSDHPKKSNTRQKSSCVRGYQSFLSERRKGSVIVHQLSPTQTDSKYSSQAQIFPINFSARRVNDTKTLRGTMSGTRSNEIDERYSSPKSTNKEIQLRHRRKEYLRESDHHCNDESDDGYKNDNSISDASTECYSESQLLTLSQTYTDKVSLVQLDRQLISNDHDGEIRQTSVSFPSKSNRNTPLPSVEESAVTEKYEQPKILTNSSRYSKLEINAEGPTTERCKDVPMHSKESITQCVSLTTSLKEDTTKNEQPTEAKIHSTVSNFNLFIRDDLVTDKTQSHISHRTRYSGTIASLDGDVPPRPFTRSLSSKKCVSKSIATETNSTELSEYASDSSSSCSHETLAIKQIRPHTSEEIKLTKQASSPTFLGRPSTSAPSRLKTRVRKRKQLDDVNVHCAGCSAEFAQERPNISFETNYKDSPAYEIQEVHLQSGYEYLNPWSIGHYLIPEQNLPDRLGMHNRYYQLSSNNINYCQHGYDNVYIKRPPRQTHTVHNHQQQLEQNHPMKQQPQQQLYSLPAVPVLRIHHPTDQCIYERSREKVNVTERENKSELEAKPRYTNKNETKDALKDKE